MKCPRCGTEMYWLGDEDRDDGGITSILQCPKCENVEYINLNEKCQEYED